jgi:hypothetical protein
MLRWHRENVLDKEGVQLNYLDNKIMKKTANK